MGVLFLLGQRVVSGEHRDGRAVGNRVLVLPCVGSGMLHVKQFYFEKIGKYSI